MPHPFTSQRKIMPNSSSAMKPAASDQARELYSRLLVCDMTSPFCAPADQRLKDAFVSRLIDEGFTFVSFTLVADNSDTIGAIQAIAAYRKFFLDQSDLCLLVNTVDDIHRARNERKLAVGFHFQGSVPVGRDLSMVEVFYKLGIRHMLLAYNQKNFVADGCHELGEGGLSRFGRTLIAEMNRVGMLVDVAHAGYRSCMEAIEYSDRPVICSHGNIWNIHQHPRCYRDDQIKAVAASGGVFGLTGLSIFTGDDDASPSKFAEQIDYIAQLVGPQHVGLGLDYIVDLPAITADAAAHADKLPPDGGYTRSDMKQVELGAMPEVVDALLSKGYSDSDIGLVMGENWLRVMKEVWKAPM